MLMKSWPPKGGIVISFISLNFSRKILHHGANNNSNMGGRGDFEDFGMTGRM
jgi:hypothetical protein